MFNLVGSDRFFFFIGKYQYEIFTAIITLAVLEFAAEEGLLDLAVAIDAIVKTTFYISTEHIVAALERDAAKKKTKGNFA